MVEKDELFRLEGQFFLLSPCRINTKSNIKLQGKWLISSLQNRSKYVHTYIHTYKIVTVFDITNCGWKFSFLKVGWKYCGINNIDLRLKMNFRKCWCRSTFCTQAKLLCNTDLQNHLTDWILSAKGHVKSMYRKIKHVWTLKKVYAKNSSVRE